MQLLDSRHDVPNLLARLKSSRVLLFHGRSSYTGSGMQEVIRNLNGVRIEAVGDIPENPELAFVRQAADTYTRFQPDTIIAVGGGSVIDTAKGVLAYCGTQSENDLFANRFTLPQPKPHFIAIPTTAGSGSEATHFAVLYRGAHKFSLANQGLLPDTVILDPQVTVSCPLRVTLAGAADAICQAIESYWSKGSTEQSRAYSLQALPLALSSLRRVVDNPDDLQARASMQQAAHLAGKAINITKTTAGHALSYGLTSYFGVPHGLAVLMIMQQLIPLMHAEHSWNSQELDWCVADSTWGNNLQTGFQNLCSFVWEQTCSLLPPSLANPGPEQLTAEVNLERLGNHPVALKANDIIGVYRAVFSAF